MEEAVDVDIDHLRTWIGRTEESHDLITASPPDRLDRMLDRADPAPGIGDPIGPLRHTLFFLPNAPQSEIGPDGHAKRGGFLPPVPLPRRMFAGSRVRFHAPLKVGDTVRREATILDVSEKKGSTGQLVFVSFRFSLFVGDTLCLEDERDVVYREPAPAGGDAATRKAAPPPPPERDFGFAKTIDPDPVVLFRYSALTYNGHRIHYDRSYVTEEEGYPGLIVHGPLTALYLLELARDNTDDRPFASFSFRARAPLFDVAPFTVGGRLKADGSGCDLEAVTPEGATATTAEVVFA
jgi:3-methylfumaryl-CoA hydratase